MEWWNRATWAQRVGAAFGTVYVLVGLAGFAVTTGVEFLAREGNNLIVFEVNPLHNIVHLAIGVALLGAAISGPSAAAAMNLAVGATYGAVALAGFLLVAFGNEDPNILALNHPDNVLHIASSALLIWSVMARRTDSGVSAARQTSRASRDSRR